MTEKIDVEKVRHIAKLSRLALTPEEEAKFPDQLSSILDYVSELNELNTDDVAPTANITGLSNVFLPDEVRESGITHEDIAINAPEFKEGSFVVPGVFE